MQAGYFVFYFVFPVFLEGCCMENHQRRNTGLQQNITHEHYRAVEGEIFVMPCLKWDSEHVEVVWDRMGEGREENEHASFDCGSKFHAEAKYSGVYMCRTCGGSRWSFHLQVVDKTHLRCFQPAESSKILVMGGSGQIPCPGLNCSDNTDVIWYKERHKGIKAVAKQHRNSCEQNGWLHLCPVRIHDSGVYFCDRQMSERGVKWTFRRAVNVTVVQNYTPSSTPWIMYPAGNSTQEVVLGHTLTLSCEIYFPFEMSFSPKVGWYMDGDGNTENMTPLQMKRLNWETIRLRGFKVTQTAIITDVTPQHLDKTYSCIATNIVGNSSVTIKLKKKHEGTMHTSQQSEFKWPSLVGYPFGPLLLVAGLGVILHVKWLEVQLIFKSHFQLGRHNKDAKEFDVFLSHMWSPTSEVEGLSSQSACETDDKGLSSVDPLNSKEGKATQPPLEVLLPQVLEDQWGYRLCLLERDVLPGGAYTNDVVLALQRSQMLICILSADYLSNSNAVFVLESGLQAFLHNSNLELLLIWTNRASASQVEPDPPLPTLVQRALKVLPIRDWSSGKPAGGISNFWMSLRKAMPNHRVKLLSLREKDTTC